MDWTDAVLTTPTIGVLCDPWFIGSGELLSRLQPVLERWRSDGQKVEVSSDAPLKLSVRSSLGYNVAIDSENILCQFAYPAEIRDRPNDVPELNYPVPVQRFSELLPQVSSVIEDVTSAVIKRGEHRGLRRFGIVVAARLDSESPVPGVSALLDHCGRPWGGKPMVRCATHITITLSAEGAYPIDRCHHQLDLNIDRKNDLRCTLDWQRHFEPGTRVPSARSQVEDLFRSCIAAAQEYVRRFGEGDLSYE